MPIATDTCRCGDILRSGEVLCEFCRSWDEYEARWIEIEDALGDAVLIEKDERLEEWPALVSATRAGESNRRR